MRPWLTGRCRAKNIVVSVTIAVLRVVTPYILVVWYLSTSEALVHLHQSARHQIAEDDYLIQTVVMKKFERGLVVVRTQTLLCNADLVQEVLCGPCGYGSGVLARDKLGVAHCATACPIINAKIVNFTGLKRDISPFKADRAWKYCLLR